MAIEFCFSAEPAAGNSRFSEASASLELLGVGSPASRPPGCHEVAGAALRRHMGGMLRPRLDWKQACDIRQRCCPLRRDDLIAEPALTPSAVATRRE
jgi:hypothetical protein